MTKENVIEDIKFAKYKLEEQRIFPSLNEAFDMAIKALEQEPKRGKWLPENADVPTNCSVCGHSWDEYIHGSEIWYTGDLPHFCPHCGSYNGGDEND